MTGLQNGLAIAIVGAAGFLGRTLVTACSHAGLDCVGFTRARPCFSHEGLDPDIERADVIFWLASSINPKIAEESPEIVATDRDAFSRFLELLNRERIQPHVVLASSGGTVYDSMLAPPHHELSPTRPTCAYGAAKLDLEQRLLTEAPARRTILRISNAYGPGQPVANAQGVVAHWLRSARRGEDIHLYGSPETTRDFIYITDVCRAMIKVATTETDPEIINVGSGVPTTLGELANVVLEVVGQPGMRLVVEPPRTFDVSKTWLDVSLAETVLEWSPIIELKAGVQLAWDVVRSLGDPQS
jgi:UDP-glucose 4-epimerase